MSTTRRFVSPRSSDPAPVDRSRVPEARRSLPRIVTVPAVLLAALPLCRCQPDGSGHVNQKDPAPVERAAEQLFTEITKDAGLESPGGWPDGTFFLPEITGGGIALLDYDNDDDLDLLQVRLPRPDRRDDPAPDRLYQQQPDGRFLDVTEGSGLDSAGYGQGLAVGDTDNDGDLDVYVSNLGPDAFFINNGDGTFTDVTDAAGFSGDDWSTSATFCDYDGDGHLDLYVAHYLRYEYKGGCKVAFLDYCGPRQFDGVPDQLYRNNGDGTFSDETEAAGIRLPDGGKLARGLGVVCADLTGDGWDDIFVANDGEANQLWVNQGDGTFAEEGIMRGVAVNRDGTTEASMGVAVGDVSRNGFFDLFLTHLWQETNTLYGGAGPLFNDNTLEAGLAEDGRPMTGFGCGFFDYDNDGDLDLAMVNGRVYRNDVLPGASLSEFWNLYAEPNFLYENDGTGRFRNVSDRARSFAGRLEVSRGLAFGDIDNDGDVDLALTNVDNSVRLFRNDAPRPGSHWLRVRALTAGRDAVGARVVVVAGGDELAHLVLLGYSYVSSSDPRVHFGLGSVDRVDAVEVLWPDGARERFPGSEADRELRLVQGTGEAL